MALSVALPSAALETENLNTYNSFGLIDILGLSQSSPSPSVSSESSGIGSLGSLKSESVNSESLPSSPHTTDKKVFAEHVEPKKPAKELKVNYRGRNILDMISTLREQRWSFKPAELPQSNPALFFANRSQYHRLGPYGLQSEYSTDRCKSCGFQYVIAQHSE